MANNRQWKVNEAILASIYKEIKKKVTEINRSHQEPPENFELK
jgi:hypothetical protein